MSTPLRRKLKYALAALLGGVLVGGALVLAQIRTGDAEDRANHADARASTAADGAEQACAQVHALGGVCAVDPDALRGETGAQGDQGPKGDPGRGLLSSVCNAVTGRWVQTWSDGAVTDPGPCIGAAGKDGSDGKDGQSVTGPTGPTGPTGAAGADGRGLTDSQCNPETGRWVQSWTDGTTSDGGPCMWRPGPGTPS